MTTEEKCLRPTVAELDTIKIKTAEALAITVVSETPVGVIDVSTTAATVEVVKDTPSVDDVDPYTEELNNDIEQLDADFQLSRMNLTMILTQSTEAIRDAVSLCMSSDAPRAYESLATLINAVSTANRDLVEMHNSRQKMKTVRRKELGPKVTSGAHDHKQGHADTVIEQQTNVVFTGTTKDLLELLAKKKQS